MGQQCLRKQIEDIKKSGHDPNTTAKLIQALFYKKKSENKDSCCHHVEISKFSEESLKNTYHNEEKGYLGCTHYHRNAKILAECCKKLYPCRLCHDEQEGHKIDRFATKYMMCMKCDKRELQEICNECKFCKAEIAEYYCDICKLFSSNEGRPLYHCEKCGICRVGLREESFHCDICDACFDRKGMHEHTPETCFSRRTNGTCWICLEDTYGSTVETVMLHCNHIFHRKCLEGLLKSDEYRCPACKKSVGDMSHYWQRIDSYLEEST